MSIENILQHVSEAVESSGYRKEWDIRKVITQVSRSTGVCMDVGYVQRGRVGVIYKESEQDKNFKVHIFKLKRNKKCNEYKAIFKLEDWKRQIESEIIDPKCDVNQYIFDSILKWILDQNIKDDTTIGKIIPSLLVKSKKTGQSIVLYREEDGKLNKIMPVFKFYDQFTEEELQQKANEHAMRLWNIEFDGTVKLSNHYWNCLSGSFSPMKNEIKMSSHRNGGLSKNEVEMTLIHELVHWYLGKMNLPNDDTDDEFIAECLRIGCELSFASDAQQAYIDYCKRNNIDWRV